MHVVCGALPSVVRVITRLNVGGPARQATSLHGDLAQHGFVTRLISGSEGKREGRLAPRDARNWIRIPQLKRRLDPLADGRSFLRLTRILRGIRPDIVHTHLTKAGVLGRIAARRAGARVIVHTYHGHVLEGYFLRSMTSALLEAERHLARTTSALIAVSPQIRDQLLDLRIGCPEQWHIVRVGLKLDHLLTSKLTTRDARRRLSLPLDKYLVGIVGRLVPIKDHSSFLRAAARVAQDRNDAYFVVAGDGVLRDWVERNGRALLGPRIRFLGWVHDTEALYRALDVVVLTSRNEGTPTALIEAAAAGRPVIATRVGGVADVVREGVAGILVAPGDIREISEAIHSMMSEEHRDTCEQGRRFVSEMFSDDRLTRDIATLYRCLLA